MIVCTSRRLARFAAWLLLACATPALAAVDIDSVLPVDQAFVLAAQPVDGGVAVTWSMPPGYYLYRHRMSVEPVGGLAVDGALQLPAGKRHTDEFFGEVETYRTRVVATRRLAATPAGAWQVRVKYQGCADAGICYPPQTRTLAVAAAPVRAAVAAVTAPASPAGGDAGFAALGQALGTRRAAGALAPGADALPLPETQAFGFEAIADGADALLLRFTPARGYYLYRDRTRLSVDTGRLALGTPRWPGGVAHRDAHFGDVVVYFDQIDARVPLRRATGNEGAGAQSFTLVATFQGCQADGICYPPMTRRVRVTLPADAAAPAAGVGAAAPGSAGGASTSPADTAATATATAGVSGSNARGGGRAAAGSTEAPDGATNALTAAGLPSGLPAAPSTAPVASPGPTPALPTDVPAPGASIPTQAEDTRLAAALSGQGRWLSLLGFFGAGLLLAFTPCVLPMIPILSGLIAGAGTRIGTRRALVLSLVYVVANALVFTVAGVVAGLLGANLQVAFQTPWILVAFALLFVALAASSFGLYELQLPRWLRARLGAVSERQRGGSLAGVAAMGALSALIVGPCVAPPLAAAVLYIGQSQDPLFGGAALFLLAMGMGAPLLAFGVAAGRGMPTSGPWMVAAQRLFGFVFLALAVWMLSRVLPGPVTLGLYGLVALAAAAWASRAVAADAGSGLQWSARFAMLVLALVGTAQVVGALAGSRDPLQPLAGLRGGAPARELAFQRIKSVDDLDREIAAAAAAGRPLLLDFYADWCVACKEMEAYTFTESRVHDALAGFVLLKVDVTANDALDQALMRRLGIIGPPATLYFVDGAERRDLRLFGFEAADAFADRARRVEVAR